MLPPEALMYSYLSPASGIGSAGSILANLEPIFENGAARVTLPYLYTSFHPFSFFPPTLYIRVEPSTKRYYL